MKTVNEMKQFSKMTFGVVKESYMKSIYDKKFNGKLFMSDTIKGHLNCRLGRNLCEASWEGTYERGQK